MSYPGFDRRAHGLLPTLRRVLYGAVLWCSQLAGAQAAIADEADVVPYPVRVQITALPEAAGGSDAYHVGVRTLDTRLAPAFQRFAERVGLYLRSDEIISRIERIGDGIGVDVDLSDAGTLHLLLNPREDAIGGGLRWIVSDAEQRPWSEPRLWSVGTALEAIETSPDVDSSRYEQQGALASRKLVVTQQLLLDADRIFGLHGDVLLTLRRAPWVDRDPGRVDAAVVQLRLSWRF